jgi:hypothetical protein
MPNIPSSKATRSSPQPTSKPVLITLPVRESVAILRGTVVEALVRDLVALVQNCEDGKKNLKKLRTTAFENLPPSAHLNVVTIPRVGEATAAILVAKILNIDRFPRPATWSATSAS